MDVMKDSALRQPSRRDFLKGFGAIGAGAILPYGYSWAQSPGGEGRRIDVHQHYSSPAYHALLERRASGPATRDTPTVRLLVQRFNEYTPEVNIEAMDQAGVATAMVSPTAPGVWFGDVEEARSAAREINEYAAERMVGDYPGRFGLFASLPIPDVEGSLREIEYAFDTLNADGIALLTSYDDMWLGDEAFAPIFDELNRRGAVVYTHPREANCCPNLVGGVSAQTLEYPTDTTRTIMSLIAGDTASRCPNVKFIFSHAGGTLVSIAGPLPGQRRERGSPCKPRGIGFEAPSRQTVLLRHSGIGELCADAVSETARAGFANSVRHRFPVRKSRGHSGGLAGQRVQSRRAAGDLS